MKKKSENKIIKVMLSIFLMAFLVIYFSEITGYYEYQNYKKKALTEAQITKFEEDVKSGKEVDINDYIVLDNITYDNKLSKAASKLSEGISYVVKFCVEKTFKYISKLVDE